MNKILGISIVALFIFQNCKLQVNKQEIYNKDFEWKISIPENFENVSPKQWKKMQNKGVDAIEKTYDTTIENIAKTIFVFKMNEFNYFESNYQPFDTEIDGEYLESCKNVNELLYGTFAAQMPETKVDTASTTETIDDLVFQKFKVKVQYPNGMILNLIMFSRLFDKKEFTVNIMYVDKEKGEIMLDAWRKSTFAKK
jgi:hypothetical protein